MNHDRVERELDQMHNSELAKKLDVLVRELMGLEREDQIRLIRTVSRFYGLPDVC